jgi:WD40 repeat protein
MSTSPHNHPPSQIASPSWGRLSRRAFLGLTSAALLTACATAVTGPLPTPPPRMRLPTERITPENASRVTALGTLPVNKSPVRGLAWSPDSSVLALSAYQEAQLWDVKNAQRLAVLQGHTSEVDGIAWSPNGTLLATASRDGTARLWDARQYSAVHVLQSPVSTAAMISVAWAPDSQKVATGDGIGNVQIWDVASGKSLAAWNDPPIQGTSTRQLAFAVYGLGWSPDGLYIAANRYDGFARIWEAQTGKSVVHLQTLIGPNGLAWSPDGKLLAVGTDTGAVQVWDTQTWKNTAALLQANDNKGWTYAVPWSPDGRLLAASRQDALAQIWNPSTGTQLASLAGHHQPIWAAAWSPDGLQLASGSDEGIVWLWGVR